MAGRSFIGGAAQWKELKPKFLMRSPFEWLAGTYLADDFWDFYGTKPTLQRGADGKIIRGPFIRFSFVVCLDLSRVRKHVKLRHAAIEHLAGPFWRDHQRL
jgi:hypothetical protein